MFDTDWRTLQAGNDLDIAVSKAMGWQIFHQDDLWHAYYKGKLWFNGLSFSSEAEGWDWLLKNGSRNPWSLNTDLALMLGNFAVWKYGTKWCAVAEFSVQHAERFNHDYGVTALYVADKEHPSLIQEADEPRVAICRAFLAYHEYKMTLLPTPDYDQEQAAEARELIIEDAARKKLD